MFGSLSTLTKQRRELDAAEAAWLIEVAEYDRSGDWCAEGFVNAASALRSACRMTQGVARGYLELARKLKEPPEVATAFAEGEISSRHATVIANAYTPERAAEITNVETELVAFACISTPTELGDAVRRVTDAIDGDGGADDEAKLFARRRYHGSRGLDRMLNVDALYDPESADIHERAIEAELERDHRANDERSMSQRKADAVTNLFRQSLDHGRIGSSRAVRPHVNYVVHADEHAAATPDLIDLIRNERRYARRLSPATLARIMCDCDVTRIVMAGTSEILDVGRATRTVSAAQWKALVVRDGHCQAPGCDQPPDRCQAHHVIHWAPPHNGPTNLENLQLLCWHHHRQQHERDARARAPDG